MGVIDDYLAGFSGEPRLRLDQVREALRKELPGATEVMSYGIPTFDLEGRHVIHFAGFKKHLGVYPTPQGIEAFQEELAAYPQGKGSVQFPHDRPLPLDLIVRMARHLAGVQAR